MVLEEGEYSSKHIIGLFSGIDPVVDFLGRRIDSNDDPYGYDAPSADLGEYSLSIFRVDEETLKRMVPIHLCEILIADGTLTDRWTGEQKVWQLPTFSSARTISGGVRVPRFKRQLTDQPEDSILGESVISLEHAVKVATEFRQKLLRERAQ